MALCFSLKENHAEMKIRQNLVWLGLVILPSYLMFENLEMLGGPGSKSFYNKIDLSKGFGINAALQHFLDHHVTMQNFQRVS